MGYKYTEWLVFSEHPLTDPPDAPSLCVNPLCEINNVTALNCTSGFEYSPLGICIPMCGWSPHLQQLSSTSVIVLSVLGLVILMVFSVINLLLSFTIQRDSMWVATIWNATPPPSQLAHYGGKRKGGREGGGGGWIGGSNEGEYMLKWFCKWPHVGMHWVLAPQHTNQPLPKTYRGGMLKPETGPRVLSLCHTPLQWHGWSFDFHQQILLHGSLFLQQGLVA